MFSPVIKLRDLSFGYNEGRKIFSCLDFSLCRGEKVGIVGSNGAGKSTLFYLVMGLLKPSSGQVEIFGRQRHSEEDFLEVRRRIGLLFQDSEDQLFCPTVEEDIAFGPLNLGRSKTETREIVRETCESLGLTGFEKKVTHRLSGGEKRLVALATVAAMQPECFLLDEPSIGLDERTTTRFLAYLKDHADTCIIISHDTGFLNRSVEKIYRLEDGKVCV